MTRWIAIIGVVAAGCTTPTDICEDQEHAMNAMYRRCDLDYRWTLVLEGEVVSCDDITVVENQEVIYDECIPWTKSVDCAEVAADPEGWPPSCEGHFAVHR
jgi:hypothetical protein